MRIFFRFLFRDGIKKKKLKNKTNIKRNKFKEKVRWRLKGVEKKEKKKKIKIIKKNNT